MTDRLEYLTRTASSWLVLIGGFYALVIYPYQLEDLVKGAIISLMTMAAKALFDDQQASRVQKQQESAFSAALYSMPPAIASNPAGELAPLAPEED